MNCIKKSYPTKEAAERFAAEVQQRHPEQPPQYAYACENCPNWHLSAMPPEAYALSKAATPVIPAQKESTREQVIRLVREGLTRTEVAARMGISYQTVYHHCVQAGLHAPIRSESRPVSSVKPSMTVELLTEQERTLQAQLQEVQRKREQLVEAKRLKIGPCLQGVRIEKEGNVLALSFADAQDLVEGLIEHIAAHTSVVPTEGTA